METITIGADQLQAAALFVYGKDVRCFLRGVNIFPHEEGAVITGTDGRAAVALRKDMEYPINKEIHIPIDAIKSLGLTSRDAKHGKQVSVMQTEDRVTIEMDDRTVFGAALKTSVPDVLRVIRKTYQAKEAPADFDPELLLKIKKAVKLLGYMKEGDFHFIPRGPEPASATIPGRDDFLAVVMPREYNKPLDDNLPSFLAPKRNA